MVGLIVEKPSAARNFAKALGGMKGVFNGEGYVIAVARGHLYEYDDPDRQVPASLAAEYKSWDLSKLPWDEKDFAWRRKKGKDVTDTLKAIKAALTGCDEVCFAGDVDPSGEGYLIDLEIVEELNIRAKRYSRMYFVDESVAELQKGFTNRKPVPDIHKHDEALKATLRQRWDYLSMQFTRVASKCVGGHAVLRQGRLKSAMVKLVGDQLALVAAYQKIPFYENRFRDENGIVYSNPDEPRFKTKEEVPRTYKASAVVCDGKAMKRTAPPKLLDLAGLASVLAPKGLPAKTMQGIYQKMYEAQVVSYPRTEDKYISEEQFKEMLPLVDRIAAVVGIDPSLLTHRTPRSTHVKNGGSHGANRPGKVVPKSLDDLDATFGRGAGMIYATLARNFLTMFGEDYEYEQQKGHVKDYPKFTGVANVPVRMGWKAITAGTDLADTDDDASKGLGMMAQPFVHEGFPPKPETPTMKWLMKQLEKWEVGTGATRTSTYAEVTSSTAKYPLLVDKRGKLSTSEYGEMSYKLLPGTHIGSLELTAKVWAQMKDVAAGKADMAACLHEVQQLVLDDIRTMTANSQNIKKEGSAMAGNFGDKEYFEGSWNGRQVKFNRVFRGHRLTDGECKDLLAGETIPVDGLIAKSGSKYGVTVRLADLEYNGHKYVGCEQVGFLERIPEEWCGHKFTEEERDLLEMGQKVEITDAVSKKTGKTFSCMVHWGEQEGRDGQTRMGIIPEFG